MEKKVKTACGPSVNKVTKNLDEESAAENLNEESAAGRNVEQPCVTKAMENSNEESAEENNGEQPCVKESIENLNEESAGGGSSSQNLHVNQELSSDLAERGKSPLARSIRTSDKDEHIELDEFQKSRQL